MMFIALVLLPLIAAQVDAANGTTAANAIPSGPANSGNDTTVGSPNGAPNGTAGGSSPATGALLSADTRAYLDAALKRWDIPGAAVVVVAGPPYTNKTGEDGWATEYYNYGRANAVGDPVTQDTLFPIASNTKLFTALSAGAVLAAKNLTWWTKVKDVIPDWKLMDAYASEHVDILDLASMRSGMPAHDFAQLRGASDAEVVANLRNLPPSAEIRQAFQYNNMHYASLAHVVTTLSGTMFVDWLAQNVLGPLNMTASTFDYTNVTTESFRHSGMNLTQCAHSPDLEHLDPACFGSLDSIGWWTRLPYIKGANAGEGGLISSARDMGKWFRELLAPRVVSPDLLAAVTTPVEVVGPASLGFGVQAYGAGQIMTTFAGESLIMHTGGLPGQSSLFVRMPDRGLALGIMANEDWYSPLFLQQVLVVRIISGLLGLPPVDLEQQAVDTLRLAALIPNPAPPASPAPVPDGTQPAGTYSNPGYGNFTLQHMTLGPDNPAEVGILAGLTRLGLPTAGVLYAPLNGWFDTHMTLTHWDGAAFNATFFTVVEHGGKVIVPDALTSYTAIVTPEGIGMFGNFWGAQGVPPRQPTAENVQQAAEVFFKRA